MNTQVLKTSSQVGIKIFTIPNLALNSPQQSSGHQELAANNAASSQTFHSSLKRDLTESQTKSDTAKRPF